MKSVNALSIDASVTHILYHQDKVDADLLKVRFCRLPSRYSIHVIRVRLQLDAEGGAARVFKSPIHCASTIVGQQGPSDKIAGLDRNPLEAGGRSQRRAQRRHGTWSEVDGMSGCDLGQAEREGADAGLEVCDPRGPGRRFGDELGHHRFRALGGLKESAGRQADPARTQSHLGQPRHIGDLARERDTGKVGLRRPFGQLHACVRRQPAALGLDAGQAEFGDELADLEIGEAVGGIDDDFEEFSQHHVDESISSTREITEQEYMELFDKDNHYLAKWDIEQKKRFINKINYNE